MRSISATVPKLWFWEENEEALQIKWAAFSGPLFCAQRARATLLHNDIHQLARNEYLFHDLLPSNG